MKKILIILFALLFSTPVFSMSIYEKIDERLDVIQEGLTGNENKPEEVISAIKSIIETSNKYENKYPEYRELFMYITTDFEEYLDEYKKEAGYINIFSHASDLGEISQLEVFQKEFSYQGNSYFIMRKFSQNSQEKYLVLQDNTYETSVVLAGNIRDTANYSELYNLSDYKKHQDTVYEHVPNTQSPLQNNGITHNHSDDEVFLTADFCPSGKHGFEKEFIENYMSLGHKNIGIAITSSWIQGHQNDYDWLLEKNNSGELNISWINHTKTHNYDHGVDFSHNFLLTPGLDLEDELLDVEKKLLARGQIPSIFMRYPGLVSDDSMRKETIYTYGLIPLGSNAWLAKGESPEEGSIILIHGNKNEPYGITLMNQILNENNFEYGEIESILHEDIK
ncbi:hypothetical protein LR010_00365 [Candidatus Gracilibacteria bacterium]|nr:hypothetical protein [Candidatus Gracilibacteria bacterium]